MQLGQNTATKCDWSVQ